MYMFMTVALKSKLVKMNIRTISQVESQCDSKEI